MSLKSIVFASSCSMLNNANPCKRSCPIVDLRQFLIIFSLLNDLLASATVTGNVQNNRSEMHIFGRLMEIINFV